MHYCSRNIRGYDNPKGIRNQELKVLSEGHIIGSFRAVDQIGYCMRDT